MNPNWRRTSARGPANKLGRVSPMQKVFILPAKGVGKTGTSVYLIRRQSLSRLKKKTAVSSNDSTVNNHAPDRKAFWAAATIDGTIDDIDPWPGALAGCCTSCQSGHTEAFHISSMGQCLLENRHALVVAIEEPSERPWRAGRIGAHGPLPAWRSPEGTRSRQGLRHQGCRGRRPKG